MTAEATIHISSAVVSVLPQHRDEVLRLLAALPDLETHQSNASKIVIVMEAAESGILGGRLAEIASWQGVCRPTWCSSRSSGLRISETRTCHSRDANC